MASAPSLTPCLQKVHEIHDPTFEITTFTKKECHFFYEVGRVITKPWSVGITQVIHWWKEGNFTKIYSIALAAGLIIISPLALPGFLLRLGFFHFRHPFAYDPSRLGYVEEAPQDNLKLMTWNVALNPSFICKFNGLSHSEERVGPIVNHITASKPHIICLQEVYDLDAVELLCQNLKRQGYHCIHSVNPFGIGLSSGLFMAIRTDSTLKVDSVASWQFNNLVSNDQFSSKGVLGVKLTFTHNGASKSVFVFNTHLQASYGKNGYGHVRQEQVRGLSSHLREWTKQNQREPTFLCGDFNFTKKSTESGDNPLEYQERMRDLQDIVEDGHAHQQDQTNDGSFIDPKSKSKTSALFDYIFTNWNGPRRQYELGQTTLQESDHRPLTLSITIHGGNHAKDNDSFVS